MKILLDESLPRRLKMDIKGHHVKTVPEVGWSGKKNGELLALMTGSYDVFITADQNLQYQLNFRNTSVVIIVIASPSNRYDDIRNLVPEVLRKLNSPKITGIIKI